MGGTLTYFKYQKYQFKAGKNRISQDQLCQIFAQL